MSADPDGPDGDRKKLADEIAGVVGTLQLIRQRMKDKVLGDNASATEFMDGLDLAWLGGRRLVEELRTPLSQLITILPADDESIADGRA